MEFATKHKGAQRERCTPLCFSEAVAEAIGSKNLWNQNSIRACFLKHMAIVTCNAEGLIYHHLVILHTNEPEIVLGIY